MRDGAIGMRISYKRRVIIEQNPFQSLPTLSIASAISMVFVLAGVQAETFAIDVARRLQVRKNAFPPRLAGKAFNEKSLGILVEADSFGSF